MKFIKSRLLIFLVLVVTKGICQEYPLNVKVAEGELSGTLLMPKTKIKVPIVLIISGSGPTDRNGNQGPLENNSLKLFAEELAKNEIASLRFDKRGVGQSVDVDEAQLRFDTLVNDVKRWLTLLSKDSRFNKIIVAGHSEGSLIGMIASQNSPFVKGFVSIAGAGRPADEILKEQLANIDASVKETIYSMIDTLKKGDTIPNMPIIFYSLFRPTAQPYIISWFKYDPKAEIQKLDMPVLIVQGSTDVQVKIKDAEILHSAKANSRLEIIEHMNHVLKECKETSKEKQKDIYSNPKLPLKPELGTACADFIKKL